MKAGPWSPRVLVIPASPLAPDRAVGGGERYAFEYARALADLTSTSLGLFDARAGSDSVGALTVRTFSLRHLSLRRGLAVTRETWRALAGFDLVHVMCFPNMASDLVLLSARLRGQWRVLTDVGGGAPCWSTRLARIHPRLALERSAHGLAHLSRYAATFFRDWRKPETILYGGVDFAQFNGAGSTPRGYALCVGRIMEHKGVLQVVQAVDPHTPLHVVGRPYEAEYFAAVKAAAQGKDVTFITDADDAVLQREYSGANVVLQASVPRRGDRLHKSELLGLVTLEAMACGKPVIVTNDTSLTELIVEGETGFAVRPFDLEALRTRINQLVADADLSGRMGARARAHVEANFSWAETAQRGLTFYRRLAGRE